MSKRRTIILAIILVLIGVFAIITSSYAYYTVSLHRYGNTLVSVTSSCAGVQMNANSITLSGDAAAPVADQKVLNSINNSMYRYEFTITSDCDNEPISIIFAPTTTSSEYLINALRYVIVEAGGSLPSAGSYMADSQYKTLSSVVRNELNKTYGLTFTYGYNLLKTSIDKEEKSYFLYLWIDEHEGDKTHNGLNTGLTMNQSMEAYIVVSSHRGNDEYEINNLFRFYNTNNDVE